ncbi:hypothetical protein AB0C07_37960 [Actinoplanes missouriensis]|uniref:hypothetical protein n=1 Tax=Actinoplanes missouriensis TaxID=1866 RepID=UPI0033CDB0F7
MTDESIVPASPEPGLAPAPALDSPERVVQQEICERLLTDDGRVTNTPQAKTIAIAALAERMSSPTPALVRAAFSLRVGTDMVNRLGDGDYVLVPLEARYPSKGATVRHVGELDPAGLGTAIRMDDPRAEVLVRQIAVSELMSAWAYGSNNNVRALAIQEVTAGEFGLTDALGWQVDGGTRKKIDIELINNRDTLRDFVRTQYEMTQDALAARGITEVIVYRSMSWHEDAPQPEWVGRLGVGDSFAVPQRPLSSWAVDRQVVEDWVNQRGGHAVILVDRKPARDVLSHPLTGMGFLDQKELVALRGDGVVTLDGVYSGPPAVQAEQTAASSISLGAPALGETATMQPPAVQSGERQWQPLTVTAELNPENPLDSQIQKILDGTEEAPYWWPRDDSGYAVTKHDLDVLGIQPVQVKWLVTGEAPLGLTPELYREFGTEMLDALKQDGIEPSQVDIRLKGTGANFFSGEHKAMPGREEVAANPEAADRLRAWLGEDGTGPLRRPYDAMWRLGLEPAPSDFDLDINSTALVRNAREHWQANHAERYQGDFMGGHGYLDQKALEGASPALVQWAKRWEGRLGRPVSLGVFESSGPFDATVLGQTLSAHFRETDWVIHRPDRPRAWENPRSRVTEPAPTQTQTRVQTPAQAPAPAQRPAARVREAAEKLARQRAAQPDPGISRNRHQAPQQRQPRPDGPTLT